MSVVTSTRQPRVFFSNLPQFTGKSAVASAKADIANLCRPYGSVSELVVNPDKGTAFVSFQTIEAAEVAIYRLDNSQHSGDAISVSWAKSREERDYRGGRRFNNQENGEKAPRGQNGRGPKNGQEKKEKKEKTESTEPKSNELEKKEEKEDKPRFAQFQQEKSQQKVVEEEKPRGYAAVSSRPAAPAPVVHRFKLTIESLSGTKSPGSNKRSVEINEEEYLKYIVPLLKKHLS